MAGTDVVEVQSVQKLEENLRRLQDRLGRRVQQNHKSANEIHRLQRLAARQRKTIAGKDADIVEIGEILKALSPATYDAYLAERMQRKQPAAKRVRSLARWQERRAALERLAAAVRAEGTTVGSPAVQAALQDLHNVEALHKTAHV